MVAVLSAAPGAERTDIAVCDKPRPGVRFVSGNLVYEEHLYKGGLRTRYWSPAGLISRRLLAAEEMNCPASTSRLPARSACQ